jgi:hypothetical protein|tara:strand:+ start:604 stop:750 length:147 start_codon:yes stop_codon:yes gene_type:complete
MPKMQTPAGKAVTAGEKGIKGKRGAASKGLAAGEKGIKSDPSVVSNRL